jgi:hypothetical protein
MDENYQNDVHQNILQNFAYYASYNIDKLPFVRPFQQSQHHKLELINQFLVTA